MYVTNTSLFYNNFMSAYSLNKFIEELIKSDDIIIIDELVDYNLEITEIVDRLSKSNDYNKAILFKNTGTNFPLLINAFGSDERMAKALQTNSLECLKDKVSEIISLYTNKPENVRQKVGMFFDLAKIRKWIPRRTTRKGECQEKVFETVDIQLLPILKCWPFDGGRFITLPCVHTVCPENGTLNIGMYRMQVFDSTTVGMHWHKHKTGARHFNEYKKLGLKMPVSVTLGGDPVYTFVATAPMPENINEYLLAGFLRNKPVKMVKCITNDIWVPEDVDIVIEGYVDPSEDLVIEGPFGDHTGFYSLTDLYPKMHITAITHRKGAIYPATIVGVPPMEDAYIAKATEKIFTPMIKFALAPEVVDLHMPIWGVAHNLALVSIKKEYQGQAFKVAQTMWGAGQMMFNKTLLVFDDNVDICNYSEVVETILKNLHSPSQMLFSQGPIDILDHSTNVMGFGGKVCIDLTKDNTVQDRSEARVELLFHYIYSEKNIDCSQWNRETSASKSQIVIVLEPELEGLSNGLKTWYLLNNIDPQRDIEIRDEGSYFSVIIDGRKKRHNRRWPNVVTMDEETISKVDKKWEQLTKLPFIKSPSLDVVKLVKTKGAETTL